MVYLEDFDAFYNQAIELFKSRPLETRHSVKYRHCDGKLVLKVTDDVQASSFRSSSCDVSYIAWAGIHSCDYKLAVPACNLHNSCSNSCVQL